MSNSFYVRCQDYLDLEAIQQLVQRHFGQEMELCLNRGDRDYGGLFYIKGQSTCGVEVCKEDDDLVVRLPLLADYADFFLAKLFLDIFHQFLGEDVRQEDGQVVEVRDYSATRRSSSCGTRTPASSASCSRMPPTTSPSPVRCARCASVVRRRSTSPSASWIRRSSPNGSPPSSGGCSGAAARWSRKGNRPGKWFREMDAVMECLGEAL